MKSALTLKGLVTLIAFSGFTHFANAGDFPSVVDDFNNPEKTTLGFERIHLNDTAAGGKTKTELAVEDGKFIAKGQILPPRGQPGWASTAFILSQGGRPTDVNEYEGVRLLIRINQGNLSVSANSSEITNFDYHAAPLVRQHDNEFHEVKIPFSKMKRAWSEQTPLNTKSIASLSIVAFDVQPGSFDFEVEEIGFY